MYCTTLVHKLTQPRKVENVRQRPLLVYLHGSAHHAGVQFGPILSFLGLKRIYIGYDQQTIILT